MIDFQAIEDDCRSMFANGYMCAESVFLSVARGLGREGEAPQRLATGFCAGMGRSRGTCGALTGGILALGLFMGRDEPGVPYEDMFTHVGGLVREFEERFGARDCRELTGCDLGTEAGREVFNREKVKDRVCLSLAGFCAGRAARRVSGRD